MKDIVLIIGLIWLVSLDELRIVKVQDWALKPGTFEFVNTGWHYQLIRPLAKQREKKE